MKLSTNHKNRKVHNWLVYTIQDKFLIKYSKYLKGAIYDFGCGEQPYKDFFLNYCDKYIGIDWSNTQHNLTADIVADLNKPLPIESNVADTIISISVIEHLCEPQNMLNEAYRILNKEGVMILQVPFQWHIHEAPFDYFRFTPFGLKYIFEKAGFKKIEIEPSSGIFITIALKINYFLTKLIRGPKFLKLLIRSLLTPVFFINQYFSFLLDKLDNDKQREAGGFWVIAKKE